MTEPRHVPNQAVEAGNKKNGLRLGERKRSLIPQPVVYARFGTTLDWKSSDFTNLVFEYSVLFSLLKSTHVQPCCLAIQSVTRKRSACNTKIVLL